MINLVEEKVIGKSSSLLSNITCSAKKVDNQIVGELFSSTTRSTGYTIFSNNTLHFDVDREQTENEADTANRATRTTRPNVKTGSSDAPSTELEAYIALK